MPRIKLSPQSQPSKSREAQIPTPVPPPILNLPFELVSEDIFNILRSYLSQILRFEEFEVEVSSNELRELTELICKKVEEYTIAARDVAEEDQREWINNHMRVKDRDSASISASDTRLKIKEEELDSGHELDELERTEASEFPLGSGVEKGKAAQILTQASTLDGVPPIIQRPSRNTFKKTIPQKTRDGTSCVENEQRDSLSSGKTTYTVDMKLAISELESLSTRDRSNDKIPETVPSLSNTTGLEARASRRVRAPPRFSSEEGTTATGSENVLQDLKTNCYERPASSLDNRKRRNIKVGGDQIILRPEPTRAAIPRKDASRKALEKQKTAVELECRSFGQFLSRRMYS